jgi:fructose/tagatose bisphosphate aldolase
LVNLKPILENAAIGHYAVGAFNFCNAETVQAVVEEGSALRSPIILITSPPEYRLLGPRMTVDIAKYVAAEVGVPVCLHLDHATEVSDVEEAIEAGFPSVMIDASARDFEENIRLTRSVVEMARPRGITVEAELGAVGRVDDVTAEGSDGPTLTAPARQEND